MIGRVKTTDGNLNYPYSGLDGECPECNGKLIPKIGDIRIHHWAHECKGVCNYDEEPDNEWHMGWKKEAVEILTTMGFKATEEESVEKKLINGVLMGRRSDVMVDGPLESIMDNPEKSFDQTFPLILEFQHSPISLSKILNRKKVFNNDFWIFDKALFGNNNLKILGEFEGMIVKTNSAMYQIIFHGENFISPFAIDNGNECIYVHKKRSNVYHIGSDIPVTQLTIETCSREELFRLIFEPRKYSKWLKYIGDLRERESKKHIENIQKQCIIDEEKGEKEKVHGSFEYILDHGRKRKVHSTWQGTRYILHHGHAFKLNTSEILTTNNEREIAE